MEQELTKDRILMKEEQKTKGELSCLIGNIFDTIEPPCNASHVGEIVITGTTHSGKEATLVITGDAFFFEGDSDDLIKTTARTCPHKNKCAIFQTKGGR